MQPRPTGQDAPDSSRRESARVRTVVARSWERSAVNGASADGTRLPDIRLAADALAGYRSAHPLAPLLPVVRDLLGWDAREERFIFAVADANGTLLWVEGASSVLAAAERMNFVAGAAWAEADAGTNAPGTALVVGEPVRIAGAEHYNSVVRRWSCCAVPIHGPDGLVLAGAALGASAGLYAARTVAMTAMPQLVSLFNAVGGGAAALLAVDHILQARGSVELGGRVTVPAAVDILVGAVTFSGSLIAAGKLQGVIPGRPIVFGGARAVNALLALCFGAGAVWLVFRPDGMAALVLLVCAALAFGVTMVLPIGGADMPVVISLLNAFTGTAVAMAGFVLDQIALIVAGALVGASGAILTKLAYASNVIIVPGYGLAAAQAQHELADLATTLEGHGVHVSYAIHPVAGRMPGHMNVLLAEANVPYPLMKDLEEINPQFPHADVALVIGANDVTNPAARRPGNAVSGMPILDVDQARSVIVIKHSMGHGYAGIDNELYANPKTGMCFADAKQAVTTLNTAVKTLVG